MSALSTNLSNPLWSAIKNVASQVGGRLFLTAARFGVAAFIVRSAGIDAFGEYALILTLLLVAEWLVDFGMTDIAVRAICQDPRREHQLLRSLFTAKLIQAPIAVLILLGVLFALNYPAHVFRAGLVAAVEILCYAGILVYRAKFRARMQMEREVAAEVLGVVLMIPLLLFALHRRFGLEALVGCYVASRVIFLLAAAAWSGHRSKNEDATPDFEHGLRWVFGASLPLGLAGLLVCAYDAMDPLLLSKLSGMTEVGQFSGAMRFVWPVILLVQSVGAGVFPLLASYWQRRNEDFRRTLQVSLDVVIVAAAGVLCLFQCSAEFLTGAFGGQMGSAAILLRILSWVIFARAINTILSPIVVISARFHHALWLTAVGVAVKATLFLVLVPHIGATGAAIAYLLSETLASLLPMTVLAQRLIGYRLDWSVLVRTAPAMALPTAFCWWRGLSDSPLSIAVAVVAYPALAMAFGAVRLVDLKQLFEGVKDRKAIARQRDEDQDPDDALAASEPDEFDVAPVGQFRECANGPMVAPALGVE